MKKQDQNLKLDKEKGSKRCLRNQWKYVQNYQQSQRVEDAGLQLCQVVTTELSESNSESNWSNSQDWLDLTPHCPPLLPELWLELFPSTGKSYGRIQDDQLLTSSFIEKRPYILLGQGREGGREQKMSPQPTKVRTIILAKSESRRYRAAALSGR